MGGLPLAYPSRKFSLDSFAFFSRGFNGLFLSQVVRVLAGFAVEAANDCWAVFLLRKLRSAFAFVGRILTDIGQNFF